MSLCVVNEAQTSDIKLKSKKSGKVSLLSSLASQTQAVSHGSVPLEHLQNKRRGGTSCGSLTAERGKHTLDLMKKSCLSGPESVAPEVSFPTRINTNVT